MRSISNLQINSLMDEYDSVNFSMKCSSSLDGAISTSNTFDYIEGRDKEGITDCCSIGFLVPADFRREGEIFVNEDGAVAGAYLLTRDEFEEMKDKILMVYKEVYPNYHFIIKNGRFPINAYGGSYYNDYCPPPRAEMSNYVVYITDYKKHLKEKVKEL